MEAFVEARVGQTIGQRWTLRRVLGVGGMAAVYEANDDSGAEVAVKVLHPEFGSRSEVRERFLREGYVANRVGHPGAVRVLEHGAADDDNVFLVMERLRGESLGDLIAREGTYPLPDLLELLNQVLDVLAAAHEAGIVHRDLKPDNLFLTEDGTIKVLDFGVARVLEGAPDDLRTRTGMAMGTLSYMAPEQALGQSSEIDGRIDLFALGATAFRILAQRRIHEADTDAGLLVAMATKPAPPLLSVAPGVPPEVAAIVDLALAFSRDARYPDARTMQSDVVAVQRGEAPPFAMGRLSTRDQATQTGLLAPVALADQGAPSSVATSSPSVEAFAATALALPVPARGSLTSSPSVSHRSDASLAPYSIPPWVAAVGAVGFLLLGGLLSLTFSGSRAQPAQATDEAAPADAEERNEAVTSEPEKSAKPTEKPRARR
jgi:serine/threonine protein kinase